MKDIIIFPALILSFYVGCIGIKFAIDYFKGKYIEAEDEGIFIFSIVILCVLWSMISAC